MSDLGEPLDESKLALLLTLQVKFPVAYLWLTRNPLTLEALGKGWHQVVVSPGEENVPQGYRAQMVDFLKNAYGDRVAEQNADGFFSL